MNGTSATSSPQQSASILLQPQRHLAARIVIALLILTLIGLQVRYSLWLGNRPSLIADAFSEANAIRAGASYATEGFLKHAGLPDIAYGEQFANTGFNSRVAEGESYVYTHYPPGSDLAMGLMTLLFGEGRIVLFRMFPILLGLAGMSFLAWSLARNLGDAKAAALMLGCAIVPAFSNMMHGLHYQGYSLSLLLVELGALIFMFAPGRSCGVGWYVFLFLVAFLQGWLSFDYCFLVTFAPVPLAILRLGQKGAIRHGVASTIVLGLGFTFAHSLHLLQVAVYYGTMSAALEDLTDSARNRAIGRTSMKVHTTPAALLLAYLFHHIHKWRYFGWFFRLAAALAAAAIVTGRGRTMLNEPFPLDIRWNLNAWKSSFSVVAALLISSLWILIMWQHAWYHRHFIPRHLFLVYFFFLLIVIEQISVRRATHEALTET